MPYGRYSRGRTSRFSRPYSRRPRSNKSSHYKFAQTIARREVAKNMRKVHPLQWTDIVFNGGNVNTAPTMHSLVKAVLDAESGNVTNWSDHGTPGSSNGPTKQCNYLISYCHYQLRFQQDVENIESSNTFRTCLYSYIPTFAENPGPIFDGGNVDLPPATEYIRSMYFDRMKTLRAGSYDPLNTDETDPTPGTALIKGNKRFNSKFKFIEAGDEFYWEENDIRWEAISDSIGAGLQLYGFIRIYYRRLQ